LEEIIGLDPGTHQGPDSITKQHMDILRRQLNAREGIVTAEERARDRFVENP